MICGLQFLSTCIPYLDQTTHMRGGGLHRMKVREGEQNGDDERKLKTKKNASQKVESLKSKS